MSINAYNASTISALFAGLNNSSSGTSLSYGIDFTTYNSIKNGSYSKLMRLSLIHISEPTRRS